MPEQHLAFLSYTRIDDRFFRGAITSLRELLEMGVQVTTGNRNLSIFQDVEGIHLGERFANRIDQAILEAKFLIPILTPLFFTSSWCRTELSKFLEREKFLGRADLILPIYYISTPLLEPGMQALEDDLAIEMSKRQRFDWREYTKLPADDPRLCEPILELSRNIALALDRVTRPASVAEIAAVQAPQLKVASEAIARSAVAEVKLQSKTILWVDDRPENNLVEQSGFNRYNFETVLAVSTKEALSLLAHRRFDVIISDMGRPPDSRAGYTLLAALRKFDKETPFFIYAGSREPQHIREALSRGAQGCTNIGSELIQMVLAEVSPEFGSVGTPPRWPTATI
jgi:CheY-like chemotaxis protein